MKLFVSPHLYTALRRDGDDAIPERLAAWGRQRPRPEMPVVIDYAAAGDWWRLVDDDDTTLLESDVPGDPL